MESEHLFKTSCDKCGSSDANGVYSDGHTYCFSCGSYGNDDSNRSSDAVVPTRGNTRMSDFTPVRGDVMALSKRKINEATAKFWGYEVGNYKGKPVQIANYRASDGTIIGQKLRFPDKDFLFLGDAKKAGLYGQHLWRDGGKMITITEGEIDAMSLSQAFDNKWPVVSIRSGGNGAKRDIAQQLEWLEKFETVIFMFDQDEVGQNAAKECAALLSPSKAKIAQLPLKDANDMLVNGKVKELINAVWSAKEFRPDGLVGISDLLEELNKPVERGLPWFLDRLTELTYGRRKCELYAFGAGTGIGKTDFLTQQIAYDVTELGEKVGLFFLEQQPTETAKRVAGKIAGKRFHVPDGDWTPDELVENVKKLDGKVTFYNSFGQTDWSVIEKQIRYLTHSEGITLFYIDHLTAMADTADEKGSLEQIMKEMAGLANELKVIIHFVSHLTTPDGKPHEEGGQVSIRHFKGSRAIGFWSYYMFGLERNQQAANPKERQTTTFRVLKDRYTGQATGEKIFLGYDANTSQLFETIDPSTSGAFDDEDDDF